MPDTPQSPVFCNYEQAGAFIDTVADPRTKAFLQFGLTTVLMRRDLAGAEPQPSFDLRFFVQALRAMFADEVGMRQIMDGRQDEMRWWDDDAQP